MTRALVLAIVTALASITGCGSGAPKHPRSVTAQVPKAPRLGSQRCTYDVQCFGGHGTCFQGECSLTAMGIPGPGGAGYVKRNPSPGPTLPVPTPKK